MNKLIVFLTQFLLPLGLTLSSCHRNDDAKNVKADVAVETVHNTTVFAHLSWMGAIRAERERVIAAEVEGSLSKFSVNVGDVVKAGTNLFQISPKGAGYDY